MAKSYNNLRVGKRFELINYGESFEFEVMEIISDGDYKLKDINTLEPYTLFDLVALGKGSDFDLQDL